MSTATLIHQPMPTRTAPTRAAGATDVATATETAAVAQPDYAARDAKATRVLALLTGAAALVILVFFLTMMWVLGTNGPLAA